MQYPYVVLDAGVSLKQLSDFAKKSQVMPAGVETIAKYLSEVAMDLSYRDNRLTFLIAELQGRTMEYFHERQTQELQKIVGDLAISLFYSVDRIIDRSNPTLGVIAGMHALTGYRYAGLSENGIILDLPRQNEASIFDR